MDKRTSLLAMYTSTVDLSLAGDMLGRETDFFPAAIKSFFTSGYTNEVFLSFSLFFGMMLYNEGIDKDYNSLGNSTRRGFTVAGICSLVEGAQYITGIGTYDSKDFLAYAAGAGLAMIVKELSLGRDK